MSPSPSKSAQLIIPAPVKIGRDCWNRSGGRAVEVGSLSQNSSWRPFRLCGGHAAAPSAHTAVSTTRSATQSPSTSTVAEPCEGPHSCEDSPAGRVCGLISKEPPPPSVRSFFQNTRVPSVEAPKRSTRPLPNRLLASTCPVEAPTESGPPTVPSLRCKYSVCCRAVESAEAWVEARRSARPSRSKSAAVSPTTAPDVRCPSGILCAALDAKLYPSWSQRYTSTVESFSRSSRRSVYRSPFQSPRQYTAASAKCRPTRSVTSARPSTVTAGFLGNSVMPQLPHGASTRMSNRAAPESRAKWAPDGQLILFHSRSRTRSRRTEESHETAEMVRKAGGPRNSPPRTPTLRSQRELKKTLRSIDRLYARKKYKASENQRNLAGFAKSTVRKND
eukprot:RCo043900